MAVFWDTQTVAMVEKFVVAMVVLLLNCHLNLWNCLFETEQQYYFSLVLDWKKSLRKVTVATSELTEKNCSCFVRGKWNSLAWVLCLVHLLHSSLVVKIADEVVGTLEVIHCLVILSWLKKVWKYLNHALKNTCEIHSSFCYMLHMWIVLFTPADWLVQKWITGTVIFTSK